MMCDVKVIVVELACAHRKMATGQNAPQGVEKVHYECRIDTESNDMGNNTLGSAT